MISFLKQHKRFGLALLMIFIFFLSFAIHYFFYWSKGFVPGEYYNLLIGRNWAQTGKISYESAENVILSTEAVVSQGTPTNLGNKLTFFLYGFLFRLFGFHPELPLYTTFILYSLAAVFIFLLVWRIFDWKIGLIAALLNLVAPFSLPSSNKIGYHEWAWFFLALALLFYFWSKERKLKHLILTGLFLGLSMAAKNSFFVALPAFLFLEFWEERNIIKKAIWRCAVLLIIFLVFSLPLVFMGGNDYLRELFNFPNKYNYSSSDFGHLFPDPYTFHYEKNDYLKNLIANKDTYPGGEFRLWGDSGSYIEYGLSIGFFKAQIITRIYSVWIYLKGFLSLVVFGGMFTWFLIMLGIFELFKKRNYSLIFFSAVYFASWFFWMIFLKTSNYPQLLILSPPILILAGLGIGKIGEMIAQSFYYPKFSAKISMAVAGIFLIFFFQISWWSMRELYLNGEAERQLLKFASSQKNSLDFSKKGVTAVGLSPDILSYYFDRSFVYFVPETIKKLADKKELNQVFQKYNITGFFGYDEETSKIIDKNTNNKLKSY